MRLLDLREWDLDYSGTCYLKLIWVPSSRSTISPDTQPETIKYAILSHTWQNDEEVIFQDIAYLGGAERTPARVRAKAGYTKLVQTCVQAKKDGCDYAWVDTCCINKESSSELSEAINSMWQWYCDAFICYAYLPDVKGEFPEFRDLEDFITIDEYEGEQKQWLQTFKDSRWFTRGWTLQELLAPSHVVFYGSDEKGKWRYIGTKKGLIGLLWDITGIDPLALQDRGSLPNFVAARKLSWAANRHTTKVEDRAYSLLGILGLNMPLLYGEGENAFIRLSEQLIQISTDHSVLAWEPPESSTTPPTDLLFATSPDQFFPKGRRMIHWGKKSDHLAFRLTNRGLVLDGLGVTKARDHILLNCCYEDDTRGVIALRTTLDPHTPHIVKKLMLLREFDQINSRLENLAVKSFHETQAERIEGATLLRYRPTFREWRGPRSLAETPPTVNLMGHPEISVVAAWPDKCWNKTTQVIHIPFLNSYPETIYTSALIRSIVSGKLGMIAIKFRTTVASDVDHNEYCFAIALSTFDTRLIQFRRTVGHKSMEAAAKRDAGLNQLRQELVARIAGGNVTNRASDRETENLTFLTYAPHDDQVHASLRKQYRRKQGLVYYLDIHNL